MKNIKSFRLGKRAPVNKKSVCFGDFLKVIPQFPLVDEAPAFKYPMDGNDIAGVCVVAGFDHSRQVITGLLTGTQKNFTQDEIWNFYKTQNPSFDPQGTASTNGPGSNSDNGMDVQLFLEYLVNRGYILGFGRINHRNEQELKAATYLGLSIMNGLVIDKPQMSTQFNQGLWDYVPGSEQVGGHCINFVGYKDTPDIQTCVTWGTLIDCTQSFISNQMDEAWFILMQEHVDHPGFRKSFDLKGFSDAIYQLTGGKVVVPIFAKNYMFSETKVLKAGMTSPDVMQLQKRLTIEKDKDGNPCYTYTQNGTLYFSNYFGTNTEKAVQKYQVANKIITSGTPSTTGFGQVGPKTAKALNASVTPKYSLVDAMIQVESGGDDNAEGDTTLKDHAYGALQVRQGVVDEVNKYLNTAYKSRDCLGDRAISLLIFDTYWKIHTNLVTNEDRAKAWNGGPGWKKLYGKPGYERYTKNLDMYWSKVLTALNGQFNGKPMFKLPLNKNAAYLLKQ